MVQRYRKPSRLGQIDSVGTYVIFPSTNLVAYYKLDETTGTVADDAYGTNNGTASNITRTAGKIANAASFNGSSSKIDMGNVTAMNFGTASFTISSWIKLSALGTEQGIVNKVDTADNNGFSLYVDDTNKIGWFDVASGNYADPGLSNTTLTTGVRYNIIFVRNASGTYQTYVNGILDKQTTGLTPKNISNTNPLQIGTLRTNSKYLNGLIDEVGIRNRALTQDEITTLYNNGAGLTYNP